MDDYKYKVFTLNTDEKYVVVNQTIYDRKTYVLVVGVTPDGNDINDKVDIMEVGNRGGLLYVASVEDADLFGILANILDPNKMELQIN